MQRTRPCVFVWGFGAPFRHARACLLLVVRGNARASAARIYAGVLWLCLSVPRRSLALLLRLSVPSTAIAAGALPAQYKELSLFDYKNGGRLLRPTPISKVKKLISYLTYIKHGDMMQMGILPKYEKGE